MAAHDLDSFHAEREVFFLLDLGIGQLGEKAWPGPIDGAQSGGRR